MRRAVGAVLRRGLERAQDIAGDPAANLVICDAVERKARGLTRSTLGALGKLADDGVLDQRDDLGDRLLLVEMGVGIDDQDVVDAHRLSLAPGVC